MVTEETVDRSFGGEFDRLWYGVPASWPRFAATLQYLPSSCVYFYSISGQHGVQEVSQALRSSVIEFGIVR